MTVNRLYVGIQTGFLVLILIISGCGETGGATGNQDSTSPDSMARLRIEREMQHAADVEAAGGSVINVGFVVLDGVFNSELMAPYDVIQHTLFRDDMQYMQPFIVAPTLAPVVTFEGIEVAPHYTFDDAPGIDVLIIPSTEHSMDEDLENTVFMDWLAQTVESAEYVITVCDGAFPLAATGVLAGKKATTFPGDRARFAEMFPMIDVQYDQHFVVDGKYITSVGGALSYEPAFYLVQHLYSKSHADQIAEGLVWDWDLEQVPHMVVQR